MLARSDSGFPSALAGVLLATALIPTFAMGGDSRVIQPGEAVAPGEVTRILSARPSSAHDLPRTRSIGKAADDVASTPGALALRIQFAFDSAQLPAPALKQLDAIAAGVQALPAGARVLIEGHTDAVGTDAYNETLSQRRAEAVRSYLIGRGLTASQLEARGAGSRGLLAEPKSAENRRVEFKRLD